MKVKSIKKNQVFYDCDKGWNVEYTATEKARVTPTGYAVFAKRKSGQLTEFTGTDDTCVYKTPQNKSTVNGQETFPII